MILDKQNLFSDDQALTTSAASTNLIDMGSDDSSVPTPNLKDAELFCMVNVAFVGGTSVKVSLQTDDNTDFSSAVTLYNTEAVVTASLVAGYKFIMPRLPETGVEQYIRLYYTIVGTYTAGKVTAGFVEALQTGV